MKFCIIFIVSLLIIITYCGSLIYSYFSDKSKSKLKNEYVHMKKEKFDYNVWLNSQDKKVVDEYGNPVDFYKYGDKHVVIINNEVFDPETAPIYFYEEDDDDKNLIVVSDFAKVFQKTSSAEEKRMLVEFYGNIIQQITVFHRYSFFTKKLWKKVDGFKDTDEAEVIMAFIHRWFNYKYGLQNYPVGMCFSHPLVTPYTEYDSSFIEYMRKYKPIFIAYNEWVQSQR